MLQLACMTLPQQFWEIFEIRTCGELHIGGSSVLAEPFSSASFVKQELHVADLLYFVHMLGI